MAMDINLRIFFPELTEQILSACHPRMIEDKVALEEEMYEAAYSKSVFSLKLKVLISYIEQTMTPIVYLNSSILDLLHEQWLM